MSTKTAKPELDELITELITNVVENHSGPTMEAVAADAAQAVIQTLNLKLGSYFIDDNDETAPVSRYYAVSGSLEIDGPPSKG